MRAEGTINSVVNLALGLVVAGALGACTPSAPPVSPARIVHPKCFTHVGVASWYGSAHAGRSTASGELFDLNAMTAAHRTLRLGGGAGDQC